jgi:hypothetical protein
MARWQVSCRVTKRRPLGEGGQARVLTATRRADGH